MLRSANVSPYTVIDTNVLASGLITAEKNSPTAGILKGILKAEIPYLLSEELLTEYSGVLYRPAIVNLHRLSAADVDILLTEIVANANWREPVQAQDAPDSGDSHLWPLLTTEPGSILVTGDKLLQANPPPAHLVISPRNFVDSYL